MPMLVPTSAAADTLRTQGYALTSAAPLAAAQDATSLLASWDRLPIDPHLADGGKYRFRRHASFIHHPPSGDLALQPYRPHWQPVAFNKLHGGLLRDFAPIEDEVAQSGLFRGLLSHFGEVFAAVAQTERWFVEAHQFRIDASSGEGRPTPEGAHRDGVDFVALVILQRRDLSGGSTTIQANDGTPLCEVTLSEPWTAMLLDDQRVIHGTTPIRAEGPQPHRDTLVLTYRRDGFLEPKS
ncbi:MAG: 2OG-Fe dioxygenase family protein [Verrucomicrobia bacterium]|nr:2OG-Fe dioxygenase family protein [Verrucomicrobiota bacterium]